MPEVKEEFEIIVATLCFFIKDNQILLGLKKRGFGEGKWNGFGGKVMAGETIEAAMKRETLEECGLEITNMKQLGFITFKYLDAKKIIEGYIFCIKEWKGEVVESEEMKPQWFDVSNIPYQQMWVNDPYWLPVFLEGKNFTAEFIFQNNETLISHSITCLPQAS